MSTTKPATAIIICDENFRMIDEARERNGGECIQKIDWSEDTGEFQVHIDLTRTRYEIAGIIYQTMWFMYEHGTGCGDEFCVIDSDGKRSECAWDAFGMDYEQENVRKKWVDEFLFKGVPTDEPDHLKIDNDEIRAALDEADLDSFLEDDDLED